DDYVEAPEGVEQPLRAAEFDADALDPRPGRRTPEGGRRDPVEAALLGGGDEPPPGVGRQADPGALPLARDGVEPLGAESRGQAQGLRRGGAPGAIVDVAEEPPLLEAADGPVRARILPRVVAEGRSGEGRDRPEDDGEPRG